MEEERYVKVTQVGYFRIKKSELGPQFEAKTFEEALENQRNWLDEGVCDPSELTFESLPHVFTMEWANADDMEDMKNLGEGWTFVSPGVVSRAT